MYSQNKKSLQNKKTLKNNWFYNTSSRKCLGENYKVSSNSIKDDNIPETESSGVSNIKHNMERKSFICVQAPTGSGKTYHMCHNAANLAQLGKTVILAFPNKNLLNENIDFLKSILSGPCDS